MKLTEHDIRDGESSADYVRRIPLWRQAILLLFGLAAFTVAISYMALIFVTARQMMEQLPLWLNLYLMTGIIGLYLVTAVVMEFRDRRRH
jgi:hypothetical protein